MYYCYMHTIYVSLLYAHHLCITVICTPFMYYCYMHTIYVLLLYAHHLCISYMHTIYVTIYVPGILVFRKLQNDAHEARCRTMQRRRYITMNF